MKRRALVFVTVVVVVLFGGGTGALYAYDATRSDHIANGISAGGVDIGGLDSAQARLRLEHQLAPRLERPVTLVYGGKRFVLTAQQASLHADIGAMVDAAVARSRHGSFFSRALRDLRGDDVKARLRPRVGYSATAVHALVTRTAKAIDREPVNAQVRATGVSLNVVPSKTGIAVRRLLLERIIRARLADPAATRTLRVPTRIAKPWISTKNLAKHYPYFITIQRSAFQLRLWDHLKLRKVYPIAVGQVGLETPAGLYHVQNKAINPAWQVPNSAWAGSLAGQTIPGGTPENPLKARWLGIYNGAGIHGTSETWSLGHAASHGCIRMSIPDVIELNSIVPLHTPVYIQ